MAEKKNQELIMSEELSHLVDRFGSRNQDGAKEAIRMFQRNFGCVSLSHQEQIANAFDLEEKIIKTIIRFMPSVQESIVEYELVFCSGRRCGQKGSILNLKVIKEELGINLDETTKDGKIRLTTQNCFKSCGLGPNIMVNGKLYNHMDEEKTRALLREIKG